MNILALFVMLSLYTIGGFQKDSQNKKKYTVNSVVKIELISNPTTGYTWKWTNKKSVTIVDSVDFSFKPNSKLTGSGGVEIWKFKCKKKGTEVLEFKYNRSWEPNSDVNQKSIKITVK
jgi:inhibitor of cysteine peptidase